MPARWPAVIVAVLAVSGAAQDARPTVADRAMKLTRDSRWTLVSSLPVAFRTWHPQGMVKIGDEFFVWSVEVRNRAAGEGVGHLFRMTRSGQLVTDLTIGEGAIYHPGGIDYDGTSIWMPVAEYRPDSRTIVYRVDPRTMKAAEWFRFADHIGAIVHDTDGHALHGVSWGSRRFYRWPLGRDGRVTNPGTSPDRLATPNVAHYIDYQDCKYAGRSRMLCTGLADMRQTPGGPAFRLGGLELVDLRDGRPLFQLPVPLWTAGGLDMTHNPVWIEPAGMGLRAYFMPEDDRSTIYVYDVSAR